MTKHYVGGKTMGKDDPGQIIKCHFKKVRQQGHLVGSVSRTCDSGSRHCESEPMLGVEII